jgi:hypothetical protein
MLCTCQRPPGMAPGTLVDVEFELNGERFSQRGQVLMPPPSDDATRVRLQFVNAAAALTKAIRAITGEVAGTPIAI